MTSTSIYSCIPLLQEYKHLFEQNKWYRIYYSLVIKAQARTSFKDTAQSMLGYIESHHIIPTSFTKDDVSSKNNIAHLTAKEHFIAHKLLIKCTTGSIQIKAKKAVACFTQTAPNQKRILNSNQYEYVRKMCSESVSGANNPMFGKSASRGRFWVTNGISNKFVREIDEIPSGWVLGSILSGKIMITNGLQNTYIAKTDVMPDGWHPGSNIEGRTSKLKGKTVGPYSESRKVNARLGIANMMWITDSVIDKKVKIDLGVPDGFRRGRTNGVQHSKGKFTPKLL